MKLFLTTVEPFVVVGSSAASIAVTTLFIGGVVGRLPVSMAGLVLGACVCLVCIQDRTFIETGTSWSRERLGVIDGILASHTDGRSCRKLLLLHPAAAAALLLFVLGAEFAFISRLVELILVTSLSCLYLGLLLLLCIGGHLPHCPEKVPPMSCWWRDGWSRSRLLLWLGAVAVGIPLSVGWLSLGLGVPPAGDIGQHLVSFPLAVLTVLSGVLLMVGPVLAGSLVAELVSSTFKRARTTTNA